MTCLTCVEVSFCPWSSAGNSLILRMESFTGFRALLRCGLHRHGFPPHPHRAMGRGGMPHKLCSSFMFTPHWQKPSGKVIFFLFWLLRGLWSSWARDQIRATARSELLQWRCQALNPLHLHRQGILSVACRFFSSLSRDCYAGPVYPFVVIFKEKFWNLCFLNPRVRLYFWLDQGLRWKEEEGRCVLVDSVNKRWRLIGKEFTVWISS